LGLKEGVGLPFGVFVGVRLFFRGKQLRPKCSTGNKGKRLVRKPGITRRKRGRSQTCHKKQSAKHQTERLDKCFFLRENLLKKKKRKRGQTMEMDKG
jgi:hypothetical protein